MGTRVAYARRRVLLAWFIGSLALAGLCGGRPAVAADESAESEFALLIDVNTDGVLYAKAPDAPFTPASLAKLMTAVVVFDEIRAGRLKLDDRLTVSQTAWRRGGAPSRTTSMFAAVGSSVGVRDLLQGLIVDSGNDAAIVLAEAISGSEEAFARLMNERAKALGLTKSKFRNATGLPAPDQAVSARDLARIAGTIIAQYPEFYTYYAQPEFVWNRIRQTNKNPLLGSISGVDGLAVGGTIESGLGLVISANRDGRRLLLVLGGAKSDKIRNEDARRLIEWGYDAFQSRPLFAAGDPVSEAKVFGGARGSVPLVSDRPVSLLVPRGDQSKITARVSYNGPLRAPVPKDKPAGTLRIWRGETLVLEVPLKTATAVEKGDLTSRAFDGASELVRIGVHAILAKI